MVKKKNLKLHEWQRRMRKKRPKAEKPPRKLPALSMPRGKARPRVGVGEWLRETRWNECLQDLKAFRAASGHCLVPQKWRKNPRLALWVSTQRMNRAELTATQAHELNKLGFDWNPRESAWNAKYRELVAFHKKQGHCNLPAKSLRHPKLATWVQMQRTRLRRGTLSAEQHGKLNELGFQWDVLAARWDAMYESLRDYRKRFGNCNVPQSWKQNPSLAVWVTTQRAQHHKKIMPLERKERLEALGFEWKPYLEAWERNFTLLQAFKLKHAHCDVPQSSGRLGTWLNEQRVNRRIGVLDKGDEERLTRLGVTWEPHEATRNGRLAAVRRYSDKHGRLPTQGLLASWLSKQRIRFRGNTLSAKEKDELMALGVTPNPEQVRFEDRLAELRKFKQRHGHCLVPQGPTENNLGSWVNNIRSRRRKGAVSNEKIMVLDALGFVWEVSGIAPADVNDIRRKGPARANKRKWQMYFDRLKVFYRSHGHSDVPQRYKDDPRLGTWVGHQRRNRERLRPEQLRALKNLEFSWDRDHSRWDTQFQRLVAFQKKHGHCAPSITKREEHTLALWVRTQREYRLNGKVTAARIRCLDEIGFSWEINASRWNRQFTQLEKFQRKHGHCNVFESWSGNDGLATWAVKQRSDRIQGILSAHQTARLNGIGFDWAPYSTSRDRMHGLLEDFVRRTGHANVPKRNSSLSHWANQLRREWRESSLPAKEVKRLHRLGFAVEKFSDRWEARFEELAVFKEAHGTCHPEDLRAYDERLTKWCKGQRVRYRQGKLKSEQIRRLDTLGFEWNPDQDRWERRFRELEGYRQKDGQVHVPRSRHVLHGWLANQRQFERKGKLDPVLKDRLQKLGVRWLPG